MCQEIWILNRILKASDVPESLGRGPAKPQPDGKAAPVEVPSEASRFEYLASGLVNLG